MSNVSAQRGTGERNTVSRVGLAANANRVAGGGQRGASSNWSAGGNSYLGNSYSGARSGRSSFTASRMGSSRFSGSTFGGSRLGGANFANTSFSTSRFGGGRFANSQGFGFGRGRFGGRGWGYGGFGHEGFGYRFGRGGFGGGPWFSAADFWFLGDLFGLALDFGRFAVMPAWGFVAPTLLDFGLQALNSGDSGDNYGNSGYGGYNNGSYDNGSHTSEVAPYPALCGSYYSAENPGCQQ
jgi:hypothetical protein